MPKCPVCTTKYGEGEIYCSCCSWDLTPYSEATEEIIQNFLQTEQAKLNWARGLWMKLQSQAQNFNDFQPANQQQIQNAISRLEERLANFEDQLEQRFKRLSNLTRLLVTKTCPQCDLRSVDLCAADLEDAHLPLANLSDANLRFARLLNADLVSADLSSTNLSRTVLSGAKLWEANLSGADLRYADLSDADLSYANLSGADLTNANLSNTNLSEANLEAAKLRRYSLVSANLCRAKMPDGTIHE